MNSIDYSNNLFAAIDIITNKKLRELPLDKTIKCLVEAGGQAKEILVSYQNQRFKAQSSGSIMYNEGDIVYVLIPEGDMRNKKFIIEYGTSSEGSNIEITWATDEEIDKLFEEETE